MRTKHLLYTMALAGIFAACTQDEFETVNGTDALTGRKSIGQVTFTEAPSTRWAVESWDKIAPEADDAFSLMLVDNPRTGLDGMHLYPIDNYELIEKAQTNYIFRKGSSGWSNEAELVEGNYLYVAPAQEGKLDRNTVEINLPTEQNLTVGADGKIDPLSAIKDFVAKDYPFYIGHRFLSEGGSVSLPNMQSIFAYPEITITQTDAYRDEVAVVKKVIIKQENTDDAFVINAPLNPRKAAELLTNEFFADREKTDVSKDKVVIGEWAGHANKYFGVDEEIAQVYKNDWINAEKIAEDATFEAHNLDGQVLDTYLYNNGLYGSTSELLGTPQSKSQYIVINMPGDGVALKYGESIKFNAVIPAATYTLTKDGSSKGLTIYAVLDNNEAYKKVVSSKSPDNVIDIYPGKRYPNQDYTGLNLNSGAGKYFTIDLCEKDDGTNKFIRTTETAIGGVGTINTTEDLIAAIQAHTSAEPLYLTIEGRNVVYNKAVNDAVTNKRSQQVTIQGHIKVQAEKGTTLKLYSRMLIEDATIAEGGKIVANENNLKKVVVAPKAELELTDVDDVNKQAEIINAGTLTLSTADFVNVDNHGVLKVNYDLEEATGINVEYLDCVDNEEIISSPIDLDPSVEIMAGGKFAISGPLNYPITIDAKTSQKSAGELVLNAGTKVVKEVVKVNGKEIEKEGSITNNGVISTKTGTGAQLTIAAGRTMTVGNGAEVKSVLNIEGASHTLRELASTPVAPADYIPAATVTNNGTLNRVYLAGKLVMGEGSRVNANISQLDNVAGEVNNTAKGTLQGTINSAIKVYAQFDGLMLDNDNRANTRAMLKPYAANYKVNTIKVTGAVVIGDIANGDHLMKTQVGDVTLEFAEGSSLEMGYGTFKSDLNMTVTAKDIQWNGRTGAGSQFDFNSATQTAELYLTKNSEGNYTAVKGNVKCNNCENVPFN